MIRQAKCIGVDGDEDGEFSDLVGTVGKLQLAEDSTDSTDSAMNWFNSVSSGGNSVGFTRRRVVEKEGVVKVFTKLGRVFKFRLV